MRHILTVGILVLTLVVASPSVAQNLLNNPGFESGFTDWFTFGNGQDISDASNDNIFRSGAAAAKSFGEYSFCPRPGGIFDAGGYGQAFTPTPGSVYQFSGYSFVATGDSILGTNVCDFNRAIAKVVFFDSPVGGFEIGSNEILIGDYDTPLDQWLEFSVTSGPAPANAQRVEALIIFLQPDCDDGTVYVDDLFFEQQTPPAAPINLAANPSFDNGLSGWGAFGNAFYDGRAFYHRTTPGSAKLFGTFTGDTLQNSVLTQRFDAIPGADYTFELYTLVNCRESPIVAGDFARAKLQYIDATGAVVDSVETVVADSSAALGTWTHYSLTQTAPATADSVEIFIIYVQPDTLTDRGAAWFDDVLFTRSIPAGIGDETPTLSNIEVESYPNPFNPTTTIRFVLPEASHVTLEIYDVSGALVTTLLNEPRGPGVNTAVWDATNAGGSEVSSGVYFYKLRVGKATFTRSMTLLK